MAENRLALYNGALTLMGERELATISENREPRRLLDSAWDRGVVQFCLKQADWNWASRAIELTAAPDIEPEFGFAYGFTQPDDMLRICALCVDPYFRVPLERYSDERKVWYADVQTLYLKYVSGDDEYGLDLSLWPKEFDDLVEAELAKRTVAKITQSDTTEKKVNAEYDRRLLKARGLDGLAKPPSYPPVGTFVRARTGSSVINRRSRYSGSV